MNKSEPKTDYYASLLETIYLNSIPDVRRNLLAAKTASDDDFVPANKADILWNISK